jgi:hypothetical protein
MMETRANPIYKGVCGQARALICRLKAVFSGETKLALTALGSLCALIGVFAFAARPAQAAVTHEFLPE